MIPQLLVVLGAIIPGAVQGLLQQCDAAAGSDLGTIGHFCNEQTDYTRGCNASLTFATQLCAGDEIDEAILFENCEPDIETVDCCLAPKSTPGLTLIEASTNPAIYNEPAYVKLRFNFVVEGVAKFGTNVRGEEREIEASAIPATTCELVDRIVGTFDLRVTQISGERGALSAKITHPNVEWEGSIEFKGNSGSLRQPIPINSLPFLDEGSISHHWANWGKVTSAPNTPTNAPTNLPSTSPNVSPSHALTSPPTLTHQVTKTPTNSPSGPTDGNHSITTAEDLSVIAGSIGGVIGCLAFVACVAVKRKKDTKSNSRLAHFDSSASEMSQVLAKWEDAADNPLREESGKWSKHSFASSRFVSIFLPQWGDRANLGSVHKSSKRNRSVMKSSPSGSLGLTKSIVGRKGQLSSTGSVQF